MAVKLNVADLDFILRQIKISEAHAAGTPLTDIWVDADGDVVPAATPGAVPAISDPKVPYGLRTVDGQDNNVVPGREAWGAGDQPMPRLLDPNWRDDQDGDEMPLGPPGGPLVTNTDYGVIGSPTDPMTNGGHTGNVADADPRIISNLVNDQSVRNPAAVEVWFANEAAVAAFHARYGDDAIPVRPGEGAVQLAVANSGFEAQSLADGEPGVISNALGNYTIGAPDGWSLTGTGGLFSPAASVIDGGGVEGNNVAWMTAGGTLSQDVGAIGANSTYTLEFRVGDRTDQAPANGVARLVAVAADNSTQILAQTSLPTPANGDWADVQLSINEADLGGFVGQTLRIEIVNTSGGQALIDGLSLNATSGNRIEIDNIDMASIPNIAPDDGISAPFNAWMTFFGQFFDHGLDLITKGDNGTVYIPLQADDPLVVGADGIAGTADDLPNHLRFMAVTRATPVAGPGPDGIMGTADDTNHEGNNVTTPFVDQNQTYTSHASHQVFLREYKVDANGQPVATGKLLDKHGGGLATWADVKAQARDLLGIELTDGDVLNIPLLRTDPYGAFIRGPNGLPQIVVGLGPDGIPNTDDDIVVEGDLGNPVNTFTAGGTGAVRIGHAFLDDIAHAANPSNGAAGLKLADDDTELGLNHSEGNSGRYDNELLDRHFITGDGRGNENIGLTAVHHVFHSEHNRQIDAQKLTILGSGDLGFINEWLAEDIAGLPAGFASLSALDQLAYAQSLNWDGERLFQAGRFATEMQYQHLVFEEFARKIHPNIEPFVFNSVTDINPAIFAEFANVVYRFGHSMLTDSMPRVFADGSTDDMGLIAAFLNPVAYDNDGDLSADDAAAAIVLGMSVERGNAIDEFIVDSLRNNLVGLPLDLAAINIARGRDTGIPSFNEAREQLFSQTNSTWLKPYENWVELAVNLKNPMTIVNLIAAYGTHATILAADTLEEKRDAAFDLVLGGGAVSNQERFDFLYGRNGWTADNSGLNEVDLWVGGLAERIMPFGGMLGSTFTAIFEAQLEALQFGDRFYYLSRVQGQNFLNELEENSLAKMIYANTALTDPGPDGIRGTSDDIINRHIGADAFGRYDYVLEVDPTKQLVDDPEDEDPILAGLGFGKVIRDDNYLRFTGGEHVVVGGTSGNDTIITGDGDDAIWGGDGDDFIQSGFGVDLVNGGGGNDIILDDGDEGDFLKGEDGDDVIATSGGLDILMGGAGKDVIFLGADSAEVFGGQGDDFIMGGQGHDVLMGNEGDDWIEGGPGFDVIAGDNSELFFNSRIIGHDVMFAGSDEQDFDAESGDDIMVQGESVIRNEGMFGFDWAIFKGVQRDAYADLRIKIFTTEEQDILRNRFDKVEALSGWERNDVLLGDDRVAPGNLLPGAGANEGVFFNDGLDQAGIDRIAGLSEIVAIPDGQTFWEQGNILLGGGGSDLIAGNGGDDIIDGDRWLNVRIRITSSATDDNTAANEIATVDTLKHIFTAADAAHSSWIGKSMFELLVSRTIVPGQMHIVREILDGGQEGDIDIATFWDVQANYTITNNDDGSITVEHTGFDRGNVPAGANLVSDGRDTLRNIEVLRFADGDVNIVQQAATGMPVISDTTPTEGQTLSVDLSSIADANGIVGPIALQWQSSGDGVTWTDIPGATGTSLTPQDLPGPTAGAQAGLMLRAQASFTDGLGATEVLVSDATAPVGQNWQANPANPNFIGTGGDDIARGNGGANNLAGGDGDDELIGLGGADIIDGGAGNDFIDGGAGNDQLSGGDGDDVILGMGGNDILSGGLGDDLLSGGAGADDLDGGDGNDTLEGGLGIDVISGGAGDDTVLLNFAAGAGGRDRINGGTGEDTLVITGDASAEIFRIYTRDAAVLAGMTGIAATTEIVITRNGTNNASIVAELQDIQEIVVNTLDVTADNGNGVLDGGENSGDTIQIIGDFSTTSLSYNTITINGSVADDTVDISGLDSAHRIVFRGEGGNDTVVGDLRPQDVVDLPGGNPAEAAEGAGGATTVSGETPTTVPDAPAEESASAPSTPPASGGGSGTPAQPATVGETAGSTAGETRFGSAEADNIVAGAGRDMVFAGDGNDVVLAGAGNDMVFGDAGNDRLFGEEGDDFIEGGAGNDFVVGGAGNDTFLATVGDGDDVYFGDEVSGGTGIDTLDMSGIRADITVDLGSGNDGRGYAQSAETGNDVLWSIEKFIGGSGNDVITAGRAQNVLDGGGGNDTYRFLSAGDADGDTIVGFQPGDRIDLSQIDANGAAAGHGSFSLVSDAFTGVGQLLVSHETREDGDYTVIQGNISGDETPEFTVSIRGQRNLTEDDFML